MECVNKHNGKRERKSYRDSKKRRHACDGRVGKFAPLADGKQNANGRDMREGVENYLNRV